MTVRLRFCLAALLLLAPEGLASQAIRGQLVDDDTGQPIPSAALTLLTRDSLFVRSVLTDTEGGFLLAAPEAGAYRLRAQRIGYQTAVSPALDVPRGDTLLVEYRISVDAVLLDPIKVTAVARRDRSPRLRDFYARMERRTFGDFIARDQIERRHVLRTTDLLRTIPGILVTPSARGGGNQVRMRGCAPMVVIDGTVVPLYGMTIDDLVQPLELEGVEVYRSAAETPVEYGGLRHNCGAVLLWTRID